MMRLKTCLKKYQLNHHKNRLGFIPIVAIVVLLSSCANTVSINTIENECRMQSNDFAAYSECIVSTYNALPNNQRGHYEDIDRYFIDQAAYLNQEVELNRITPREAEALLSQARMEAEQQRRERMYYHDRGGRFGVGVGVGSYGRSTGYWGRYGF